MSRSSMRGRKRRRQTPPSPAVSESATTPLDVADPGVPEEQSTESGTDPASQGDTGQDLDVQVHDDAATYGPAGEVTSDEDTDAASSDGEPDESASLAPSEETPLDAAAPESEAGESAGDSATSDSAHDVAEAAAVDEGDTATADSSTAVNADAGSEDDPDLVAVTEALSEEPQASAGEDIDTESADEGIDGAATASRPRSGHSLLEAAMGLDFDAVDDGSWHDTSGSTRHLVAPPVVPWEASAPTSAPGVPAPSPAAALFTADASGPKPGAAFAKIELPGLNRSEDPLALLALAPTTTPASPTPSTALMDSPAVPAAADTAVTNETNVQIAPIPRGPASDTLVVPQPLTDDHTYGDHTYGDVRTVAPADYVEPTVPDLPPVLPEDRAAIDLAQLDLSLDNQDPGSGTLTPAPVTVVPSDDTAAVQHDRKWLKVLAALTVVAVAGGAGAVVWFSGDEQTATVETIETAPVDLPAVGTGERLEHLNDGARLVTNAIQRQVSSQFSVPDTLDEAFLASALGEPLNSYLSVTEWVPDAEAYQYRLCLVHSSGGWLLYDSLYGGIVDTAGNGAQCPEPQ